jgi:hypothetical protein
MEKVYFSITIMATAILLLLLSGSTGLGWAQSNSGNSTPSSPLLNFKTTATTADYRLELDIGPPADMLMMDQATGSATSGEVMLGGQMSPMGMTGNTYHVELHVFNIKTGATEVFPLSSVHIMVSSPSDTKITVPIAEMFDIGQGPTDIHYGNNIELVAGNYAVYTSVGSENALFNIPISAIPSGESSDMSMK